MRTNVAVSAAVLTSGLLLGSPASQAQSAAPQVAVASPPAIASPLSVKRRIAIGRFSNATNYGRALLLPGERDPLASQAFDMLSARLVETGRFIVLERPDFVPAALRPEGGLTVPADTFLVGSVTQFGRRMEGKSGFLNSHARQVASATVEVRLVDGRSGQAFFSTKGAGAAEVEVGEVAGFGSHAAYDSTLNDKAISAAISDLMSNLMQKLAERPWSSDILKADGSVVMISGGSAEGLHVGDRLEVSRRGATVVSRQTGVAIDLPSEKIATLQVIGFFGAGDAEGSSAQLVSGRLDADLSKLTVTSSAQ